MTVATAMAVKAANLFLLVNGRSTLDFICPHALKYLLRRRTMAQSMSAELGD